LAYIGAIIKQIAEKLGVKDLPDNPPENTSDWIKELAYLTPSEIEEMERQEIMEAESFFGAFDK
jgi:hypothetical protein